MGDKHGRKAYQRYKARILLSRDGSVEADSEPDLPLTAEPGTELTGLKAVIDWLGETASAFHGSRSEPLPEIDRSGAEHRIGALRVSLTRGNGRCWWHLPYYVGGTAWEAAIYICKES